MLPCSKGTDSKQFLLQKISNCHNSESIGCFRWALNSTVLTLVPLNPVSIFIKCTLYEWLTLSTKHIPKKNNRLQPVYLTWTQTW